MKPIFLLCTTNKKIHALYSLKDIAIIKFTISINIIICEIMLIEISEQNFLLLCDNVNDAILIIPYKGGG